MITLLTKLYMFCLGVKKVKREKVPRYFPNDKDHPTETFYL